MVVSAADAVTANTIENARFVQKYKHKMRIFLLKCNLDTGCAATCTAGGASCGPRSGI